MGTLREKIAEVIWEHQDDHSYYTAGEILALLGKQEKLFQTLLEDTAEDERMIRKLALKVLPKHIVEGDSYGVPTVVDLVEWIVDAYQRGLKERIEKERIEKI